MDTDEETNAKLRAIANEAIRTSDKSVAQISREVRRNYDGLRTWLSAWRDNEISSVAFIKILIACGFDFYEWWENQKPPGKELRGYLEAPLFAEWNAAGLVAQDEIEALKAADRVGVFKGWRRHEIEFYHVKLRRDAGRKARDIPK